jgi:hypothetical protein
MNVYLRIHLPQNLKINKESRKMFTLLRIPDSDCVKILNIRIHAGSHFLQIALLTPQIRVRKLLLNEALLPEIGLALHALIYYQQPSIIFTLAFIRHAATQALELDICIERREAPS